MISNRKPCIKLSKISKFISNKSITRIISQRLKIPEKCIVINRKLKCDYGYISLINQHQEDHKEAIVFPSFPSIISLLDGFSPRRHQSLVNETGNENKNEVGNWQDQDGIKDQDKIETKEEQASPFPELFKVNIENQKDNDGNSILSSVPISKSLNDQVTPLWKLSYSDQLEYKKNCAIKKLADIFPLSPINNKNKKNLKNDQNNFISSNILEPIIPSPLIEGYRNKCEFSIGWDVNGNPTVGFLLGSYEEGITAVHKPDDCLHIPPLLKLVASKMQSLIDKHFLSATTDDTFALDSKFLPFNRRDQSGLWRLLLCRIHGDKIMTVVQIHSPNCSTLSPNDNTSNQIVSQVKQELQDTFNGITDSLFLQETSQLHVGIDYKAPFQLLSGSPVLYEELCGMKFRTSPLSFIQVNSMAADKLYLKCKEYIQSSSLIIDRENTILLDLCCGTGTIGMILASQVKHVIGIDIIPEAIQDARQNAIANNVDNIEFHCGPVEKLLFPILDSHELLMEKGNSSKPTPSFIVILDPPRAGVHKSLIKLLKNDKRISQLIFISCDLNGSKNNLTSLMMPTSSPSSILPSNSALDSSMIAKNDNDSCMNFNANANNANIEKNFHLEKAAIIDMFPHTAHYEMIFSFTKRAKSESF